MPAKILAKHLNVKVLTQFEVNLPTSDLTNLNNSLEWSGASFRCNNHAIILYNENHSDARNESTIMHELSHIILNHKPIINESQKHLKLILRIYDEVHENEAIWLGSCLQIPFDGLVSALLKNNTPEQIAHQYLCSVEMAKYRINKSGAKNKAEAIKKRAANYLR